MNHLVFESTRRRAWLGPVLLLGFLSSFLLASQTSAETGDHHQAYLEALNKVMSAETRIDGEMTRISNGTVAHYDFLQHEHIELLRHAKALRHPPTRISVSERDNVIARAEALLMSATSLELVIADFLRAEALLSSAVSNTLDLLATRSDQSLTNAQLNYLQQLEQAAKEFRRNNTIETRELLETAFDKVTAINIEQTWQSELAVQRNLISSNASTAAAGGNQLAMAKVTPLAEALQTTYLAAMGESR